MLTFVVSKEVAPGGARPRLFIKSPTVGAIAKSLVPLARSILRLPPAGRWGRVNQSLGILLPAGLDSKKL
jgi:hypothetical protein